MSLFDSIKPLLRVCQFFGMAQFSMNKSKMKWTPSLIFKCFSILSTFLMMILTITAITFNQLFLSPSDPMIYRVLLYALMFLSHLHALFVLFECILKRDEQINLLNMFEKLDFLLKKNLNMNINYLKLRSICRNVVLVWICEIVAFLFLNILLYIPSKRASIFFYMLFYLPSFLVSKLSYAYSITLVTLIEVNIVVVNRYLESVTRRNGYYICNNLNRKRDLTENDNCIETKKLLFIKRAYSDIWKAAILVNKLIYFSLPAGLSNDIFVLIFYLYWFFLCLFIVSEGKSAFLYQLISIISYFSNIYRIAHNCSSATKTVRKSKTNI